MANDNKYGRLYPERAVASLRYKAERERDALLQGGNLAGASLWTDVLDLLESEGFPEDEPLFLLRGQDELASRVVRFYATQVALSSMEEDRRVPMRDHVYAHADAMERWQPRKLPD